MEYDPTIYAYSIGGLAKRGAIGKSTIYKEIAAGRLKARKVGRRTIILVGDWQSYLAGLPPVMPVAPSSSATAATTGRRPRGRPRKMPRTSLADERVPSPANPAAAVEPLGILRPSASGSHPGPSDRAPKNSTKTGEREVAR